MTTLPRKFTTIHHILLAMLTALLTCGCSDLIDEADSTVLPAERSALTLTLSTEDAITVDATSRAADGSKANEGDPEFYIGETHLFFYPTNATDVASVYSYTFEADAYTTRSVTFKLSDGVISKLFGDDGTECYVYALSNLPRGVKLGSNPTVAELKAITLNTDFTDSDALTDFVMDGFSTITLNRNSWTMSGDITLLRAAAKITLDISIKDEIVTDAGETFRPIIDDDHKIVATLYNAAATGLVGGAATDPTRLTDYKMEYAQNGTTTLGDGDDEDTYDVYSHSAFYTYPATWGDDDNNSDLHITLAISWQKTDVNGDEHFVTYNYQVPVNIAYKTIERNHHYKISLKVGVLSGELEGNDNTFDSDDISYEIADWTNDGTTINAVLTRSHYVVVHDNVFSLYGSSTQTIQYQTCHEARAYLVSVCFNATRYKNQLAYLYNTTFDEATQTYTEVDADGYSELDQKLREKYASVPEYIAANYTPGESCNILTNNAVYDESSDDNIGTITFNADINSTASMVFRPLTYTIAILNTPDHMSGRQLITITQYPSKYVEYGAAGSVYVNGYYADINGNSSMNFTTYNYTDATPLSAAYYRTSGDNGVLYIPDTYTYGGYLSMSKSSTDYTGTSYELLRKKLSEYSTNFTNTIDVHVSAFTKTDHTFSIKVDDDLQSRTYKIGDPRVAAGYTNYSSSDHAANGSTYVYSGNNIYEYYTGSKTDNGLYYRYVEKWPDVDKIKIAGTDDDCDNIIAPYFKVQSNYGNAINGVYFEVAQKRCATYQEAGYPAGRWRLPTLGEIAFIMHLQENGAISNYFTPGNTTGYWTATGGKVVVGLRSDAGTDIDTSSGTGTSGTGTSGTGTGTSTSGTGTGTGTSTSGTGTGTGTGTSSEIAQENVFYPHYKAHPKALSSSDTDPLTTCPFVRCVYDLWYWGDTPESTDEFHPMPTKNSAKSAKRRIRR
jgi:hypothetical protein